MQRHWRMFSRTVFLFVLGALNVVLLTKILLLTRPFETTVVLQDFRLYMQSIQDIRQGVNPYITDHRTTLGPPFIFLFYWPFTLFPLSLSQGIFTILNILAGFCTCLLLAHLCKGYALLRLTLLFSLFYFASFPVRFSLAMGQPNPLLGLIVAISLTTTSPFWIGVSNVVLVIAKTIYVPVFAVLHRQQLGIALIVLGAALLLFSHFISPSWVTYYFNVQFPSIMMSADPIVGLDYYNQSLRSTLYRLHMPSLYPPIFLMIMMGGILAIVRYRSYPLAIILSLLLSPVVWQHYIVLLLPILGWLGIKSSYPWKWWAVLGVYFLLMNDAPLLHMAPATIGWGIVASHFFWALLGTGFLLLLYLQREASRKLLP